MKTLLVPPARLRIFCSALFAAGALALALPPVIAQETGAKPADEEGEILTRGPVHEAFAAVVSYNPEAGLIVSPQPPEPIEEVPPEEKPVGGDVAWIPGYWAWDDERDDFIWISGTWRVLPPGRSWTPGYWRVAKDGWQWVSGYWEDANRQEVSYLAAPPETLERGPSAPSPSSNHQWVPGCWEWRDSRYAWRTGYWIEERQDWVWVPSYYVWTPRGHVFVAGYWDYAPPRRGLLFAPVYYRGHRRPHYEYRPAVVWNVAILSDYLFLRPSYCHYYFGDYYDPRYERSGFHATFSYHTSRRGYDPFYSYDRWRHRNDRDWSRHHREAFEYRRRHVDARPPRTWSGTTVVVNVNQTVVQSGGGGGGRRTVTYAQPIKQYAQANDASVRMERNAPDNRQQQVQRARQVQEQRTQRRTRETQQPGDERANAAPAPAGSSRQRQAGAPNRAQSESRREPTRVAVPVAPIVSRAEAGGSQVSTQTPAVPSEGRAGGRSGNRRDMSPANVPVQGQPAPAQPNAGPGTATEQPSTPQRDRSNRWRERSGASQTGSQQEQSPQVQPDQVHQRAIEQQQEQMRQAQEQQAQLHQRAVEQSEQAREPAVGRSRRPAEAQQQFQQQAERVRDEQRRQLQDPQRAQQQQLDQAQQQAAARQEQFRQQQAQQQQVQEQQARATEQLRDQQARAAGQVQERQARAAEQSRENEQIRDHRARASQQADTARERATPSRAREQSQPDPAPRRVAPSTDKTDDDRRRDSGRDR